MATYYSDIAADPSRMYDTQGVGLIQPFFLTTTALLASGDILVLCPILRDSTVMGYQVDCPELDTSGSATADAKLGYSGSDAAFTVSGSYIRNACRFSSSLDDAAANDNIGCILNVLPRVFTTPNSFILTISAAVATSAIVGTVIRGWMSYTMQPRYRKPRR